MQSIPLIMVLLLFIIFIISGFRTRKKQVSAYGVRGSYTGPVGLGAAIASNWMSAASFLGIAGMFYLNGYDSLAFVVGWTGGYVLLLVLMATQIRRFGKYTAPDFVGFRYQSEFARLTAAIISITITVIYSTAQFRGIALIFGWLFNISYTAALFSGSAFVIAMIIISGVLGISRNQKLQYTVLIIAFILPLMILNKKTGYFWFLPQFGYGEAFSALEQSFSFKFTQHSDAASIYQWFALCFTLMFGTAGLPHVLSRFYMAPGIKDARWGVVWGLFFISLIYWSAPAYGILARFFEAKNSMPFLTNKMDADMVLFSAATNGELSSYLVGLLAAGAMSAAFSSVSSLMLTGSASFAYDIYPKFISKKASEKDKVYAAKGFFLILASLIIFFAMKPWGMIAEIAALAFALAGNTLFPAFLLGIWWGRANSKGVISGMIVGVAITFIPFFLPADSVISAILPKTSSAFIGMPIVTAVMILVSLISKPPSDEIEEFLKTRVHDASEDN